MRKQVGLLEFEYYPAEHRCVIRASYNGYEYGCISRLDSSPCISTTEGSYVTLVVLGMAMEFVKEAKEEYASRSTAPIARDQQRPDGVA